MAYLPVDELTTDEPIDLIDELLACSNNPLRFVELALPHIKLERWQRDVTTYIGEQLTANKYKPIRVAVASGNDVGKTALLTWLILWSITTFEDALGVVTAGTEPQIRTRLWGELSKWFHQLPEELRAQFELTATALFNRQHERTWRIDIADALALTFSSPVYTALSFAGRGDHLVVSEYNPYGREAMEGEPLPEATGRFYQEGWSRLRPEFE